MERKNRILIAEDDFVVGKNLSLSLEERGYDIAGVIDSGEEILTELKNEGPPDIIIMDINLVGTMDGIAVAAKANELFPGLPILFLTSDRDRSTLEKAKLTHPSGYLIKPFDIDELVSAIELGIFNSSQVESTSNTEEALISESHIFVKSKNRLEKVQFSDILFVEANDIYASLVTEKQTYILSYPLKSIEERVPAKTFMRVHRSYIANLDHVDAIEDNCLIIGPKQIPIGKTYKAELMNRLSIF